MDINKNLTKFSTLYDLNNDTTLPHTQKKFCKLGI